MSFRFESRRSWAKRYDSGGEIRPLGLRWVDAYLDALDRGQPITDRFVGNSRKDSIFSAVSTISIMIGRSLYRRRILAVCR